MNFSKALLFFFIIVIIAIHSIYLPIWNKISLIILYISSILGLIISLIVVLNKTIFSSDLSKNELDRQKAQKKRNNK